MKFAGLGIITLLAGGCASLPGQEFLDQLSENLTFRAFDGRVRTRVSGTLDLEAYSFSQPPPGLIDATGHFLLNPRMTVFVDSQIGTKVYFFAQVRIDRGFDPMARGLRVRLDEYALRYTPWEDGRFSLQVGQFATVIGAWTARHLSWDNPFITAPLPYENLTAVWDIEGPGSVHEFLGWQDSSKDLRNPIVWGPSYATGASVAGRVGSFEYAFEVKNAALASRPSTWSVLKRGFSEPTFSGRVGYRPNPMWNFGFSFSQGAFLLSEAASSLPAGRSVGDYHQIVVAQDISFAWHHLQLWAEAFETRYQVPRIGNADTFAYFVEGKYKLTPQLFTALRWNQQFFGNIADGRGGQVVWGRDLRRADAALGYRFTEHIQLKVQYSVQHERSPTREISHLFGGQFTVKF